MRGIAAAGTLARYMSLRFILLILGMFGVCLVLIFFVDLIEMLRRTGKVGGVSALTLVQISLLRLPAFSELTLPFSVLIGSIGAFLLLSRSSELVIIRAAGISVWQFLLPGLLVAFVFGVLAVTVYNPLAADAMAASERLYAEAFGREESLFSTKNASAWLRQDGADGPTILHARASANHGLELAGVTALEFDKTNTLVDRVEAEKAVLKDGRWEFERAWVSAISQEPQFHRSYVVSTYLTPAQVRDILGSVMSISFWELPNFITIAERAGLPATQYRMQYHTLLSRPLVMVVMVLIAATCALRGFRFGRVQSMVVKGLLAGFGFFMFAEISRNLGMSGFATPVVAAWVPALVGCMLGVTVLLHKEDG